MTHSKTWYFKVYKSYKDVRHIVSRCMRGKCLKRIMRGDGNRCEVQNVKSRVVARVSLK